MKRKFHALLITLYTLAFISLLSFSAQAQPCVIQGVQNIDISTPTGTNIVCSDALITLPTLVFQGLPNMTAPGIIWGIYSDQPTNIDPSKDPNVTAFGFSLLTDENGNPVINGGTADLSQSDLFEPGESSVCITIVPIISDNFEQGTFNGECTGIVLNIAYPVICVLNAIENPEACNPACADGIANDLCQNAIVFDIANPSSLESTTYTNECATSIDDPNYLACSEFADLDDAYSATVWFSFEGNGGQYNINMVNCANTATPLANPQMAIYSGNCGALSFVACSDNPGGVSLLPAISNFTSSNGTTYYILVDGFGDQRGDFCFDITEIIAPPPCDANAGTLSLTITGDVCAAIPFGTTITGATAGTYSSTVLIVNSVGNIFGSTSNNNIAINTAGNYTAYSLNYNNEDQAAILAAIATGQAFSSIQGLIAASTVCADLGNGVAFSVTDATDPDCNCSALAGTLAPESVTACLHPDISLFFNIAGGNTDALYHTYYIIADATTGEILYLDDVLSIFWVSVNTYIYGTINIATEDEAALFPYSNLTALWAQLDAANACYAQNTSGIATILPPDSPECAPPCDANFGTINPASITQCFTDNMVLNFTNTNAAGAGYTNYYIWLNENLSSYTLSATSTNFSPTTPGNYYYGVLSVANEFTGLLAPPLPDIFEEIIIALDNANACYVINEDPYIATILPPDSPECAPPCDAASGTLSLSNSNVCLGQNIEVNISGNNSNGYTTLYVLTTVDGEIISINENTSISSNGLIAIPYEIFALNIPTDDVNLALLNTANDVSELNALLANLCHQKSSAITVNMLSAGNPNCLTCEPDAGTLPIIELPICTGTNTVINAGGAGNGYTTYYLIGTDDNDDGMLDNILQINTTGLLDLSAGIYIVQSLNVRNDFAASVPQAPTTYNAIVAALFESCYDVSSPVQVSFTNCFTCEASTGFVFYPVDDAIYVCENTTAVPIFAPEANSNANYNTLFVIVDLAGNVVGSSNVGGINFTALGLPISSYTVYVINYHSQHNEAIMNFINSNASWATFNVIANPPACIAIDEGSITYTVIPAGTGNCLSPLSVNNIVETVADDLLTYTVCFTIAGGSGNYIVDGQAITGDTYCSEAIDCGTPYSFNTTDDVASGNILVQGTAPCVRPCLGNAGIMPNVGGNVLVCSGESTNYETTGFVLGEGDVLAYVLHNAAGTQLGDIFAVNSSIGSFSAATPGIQTNTVYYLSAVVGLADANGSIIWNDACTKVAAGVPVVFLEPIAFEIDGMCDGNTGEYTITVLVTGGIPGFVPSESYQLSGVFNASVAAGQSISTTLANGSTNYTITANDGTCSHSISNNYECIKGLAVVWLNFDGEVLTEGNKLLWKTASENNSDDFVIERSNDAETFEYVGKVKAAGNSVSVRSYSFLDKNAPVGASYYRLVERDLDGTTNKSKVITLVRHETRFAFTTLSPIPACDNLEVAFTSINDGMLQLAIYNATGALVEKRNTNMQAGNNVVSINVNDYTPGIYFIRLNNGTQIISERFVVNR